MKKAEVRVEVRRESIERCVDGYPPFRADARAGHLHAAGHGFTEDEARAKALARLDHMQQWEALTGRRYDPYDDRGEVDAAKEAG